MRYTILIIPIFFFIGCGTMYTATYDIGMEQVERPADFRDRYGAAEITKQEGDSAKYVYVDSLINITWIPLPSAFYFELTNNSDHSMKIIWDESALVSPNGESMRIIHSGVKFIDKNDPQPPSVVVRSGKIDDMIIPAENVNYVYGGWQRDGIFEPWAEYTISALEPAKNHIGKSVQVLLPLEIQGNVNEYIFTFKVNDVKLPEPKTYSRN